MVQAHAPQRLVGGLDGLGFLPAVAPQGEAPGEQPGLGARVASHGYVLHHTHVVEHQAVLEGPPHAHPAYAVRGLARDVRVVEQHRALAGPVRPRDDVEKRGLAGAVRPDERLYLRAVDGERDLPQCVETAEPLGDVLYAQQRHGASPPSPWAALGRRTAAATRPSPAAAGRAATGRRAP